MTAAKAQEHRRKTIVLSRNPELAHHFAQELVRRGDLELCTVETARELLSEVTRADLCFVDRILPDGSAAEVLAAIRGDRRLASLPVVLVTAPGAPHASRPEAWEQGFDAVLEVPVRPGKLSLLVARLLGVPLRGRDRHPVHVPVFGGAVAAEDYLGVSEDLSERGMLVRLVPRQRIAVGARLTLRFSLPGEGAPLALRAQAMRLDTQAFAPAVGMGFAFHGVELADREMLRRFLGDVVGGWPFRWHLGSGAGDSGRSEVWLAGTLLPDSDLEPVFALRGPLDLHLGGLRRIAPESVVRWQELLRRFGRDGVRLQECSVGFVRQAGILPSLIAGMELLSFYAPYRCAACGVEEERLIETRRLGPELKPPPFTCRACQGPLAFDDLPERYFAFLAG
jgi:CheY-like chemotaxis protein